MAICNGSKAIKLLGVCWLTNVPVKGWAVIEIIVILWDGLGTSAEGFTSATDNHLNNTCVGDINRLEAEACWSGDGDPCTSDWAWSWFHEFWNVIIREGINNCELDGVTSFGEEVSGFFNWVSFPGEFSDGTSADIFTNSDCSKWHWGSDGWSAGIASLETSTSGCVNWKNGVWNNDATIIIDGNSNWDHNGLSIEYWSVGEVRSNVGLVWDTVGNNGEGLSPWAGTAVSWLKNVQVETKVGGSHLIRSPVHGGVGSIVTNGDWAGLGPWDGIALGGTSSVVNVHVPWRSVGSSHVNSSTVRIPILGSGTWSLILCYTLFRIWGVRTWPVPFDLTSGGKAEWIEFNWGNLLSGETIAVAWSHCHSWWEVGGSARALSSVGNFS